MSNHESIVAKARSDINLAYQILKVTLETPPSKAKTEWSLNLHFNLHYSILPSEVGDLLHDCLALGLHLE
eukprot:12916438-Ditylum_brightwellii.AAC.1